MTLKHARVCTCIFFLLNVSVCVAETGPLGWGVSQRTQDMETDRPDFTEGTQTIQPGHVQFETGYTFTYDDEGSSHTEEHVVPELLTRIGIAEDLEARIYFDGFISSEAGQNRENGASDFSLGFKHRMHKQDGYLPEFSMIGEMNIPAGSSEFSSDEIEPGVKFLWAYDLDWYALAGNLNFASPIGTGNDGSSERYIEVSNSVTIGTDVCEDVGTYMEYFGLYPADDVVETTEHYLNGGFTYAATEALQFDIRAGLGLNSAANDMFSGLGLSFRY